MSGRCIKMMCDGRNLLSLTAMNTLLYSAVLYLQWTKEWRYNTTYQNFSPTPITWFTFSVIFLFFELAANCCLMLLKPLMVGRLCNMLARGQNPASSFCFDSHTHTHTSSWLLLPPGTSHTQLNPALLSRLYRRWGSTGPCWTDCEKWLMTVTWHQCWQLNTPIREAPQGPESFTKPSRVSMRLCC